MIKYLRGDLFSLCLIIFYANLSNSQCTNPTPIGDTFQEFCAVNNSKVSDLVAIGGILRWYKESDATVPLDVSELLESGFYYVDDVSAGGCSVSRLQVDVKVYGNPPQNVNISQVVCKNDGFAIKDLSVSGENIEWYTAEKGGELLPDSTPLSDRVIYWVQQRDNGCTSIRRPTLVTFADIPKAIFSDENLNQQFCENQSPKVSDLDVEGMDIVWYSSNTAQVKLNKDVLLIDGEDYWAANTLAFGCESDSRTQITVSIDQNPNAGENYSLDICMTNLYQPPINLFDFLEGNPERGGKWTGPSDLTGGDLGVYTFGDNLPGTYEYTVKSSLGICEENTAKFVINEVNIDLPTTTNVLQEFCKSDNAVLADLQVIGMLINWYGSETSTTALDMAIPLVDGASYYASQTDPTTNCESNDRLKITVQINDVTAPTTLKTVQEFCGSDNPLVSDLQVNGNSINWYGSETGIKVLDPATQLRDGASYYATQSDTANGCEGTQRLEVMAVFKNMVKPVLRENGQQFCVFDNPRVEDLTLNVILTEDYNLSWYDAYPNGRLIAESEALRNTNAYYGIASNANGCETEPLILTVSLDNCAVDDIVIYDGFSPNGDGVNDTFPLENIELVFPNYVITFFNRWGNLVYTGNRNKPEWNGNLNGNSKELPVGVYYYVLNLNDSKNRQRQGRLMLTR